MGVDFVSVLAYGFEVLYWTPPIDLKDYRSAVEDWGLIYYKLRTGDPRESDIPYRNIKEEISRTPWSIQKPTNHDNLIVCTQWYHVQYGPLKVDTTIDPKWDSSLVDFCGTLKIDMKPPSWMLLGYIW